MRAAPLLASALADVLDERAHSTSSREYYDGCAAALEWVTGQRRTAPVTQESIDASSRAAANELRQATEMLHDQRAGFSSGYLSGVEGTLAWVLGWTEEPPL